jgi:phosphoribosylpyrophosphate synthetase
MHVGAVQPGERAIVIDDLVATGGTLSAGIKLLGVEFSVFVYILSPLRHFLTYNCSLNLVLVPNILYAFFTPIM